MKIRMRTLASGPAGHRMAGKEYTVPDAEAAELIAGGYAVEASTPVEGKVERAIAKSDPEHATGAPQQPAQNRGVIKPPKPKKEK